MYEFVTYIGVACVEILNTVFKTQNMICLLPFTSKTGSKLPFMKEKPFSLAVTPDELTVLIMEKKCVPVP